MNSYPAIIFVLKMLSTFYVRCIYSRALQTSFFQGTKQYESSLIWGHIVYNIGCKQKEQNT